MTTYTFDLPSGGDQLVVGIRVSSNGSEELAFDNICLDDTPPLQDPVALGLPAITVAVGAAAQMVDLTLGFEDYEDGAVGLTYEVSADDNPGLLASTPIDNGSKVLTINFHPNLAGTSNLTIKATDPDGQSVTTILEVHIVGDDLQVWQNAHFSRADLIDPAKKATVWGRRPTRTGI